MVDDTDDIEFLVDETDDDEADSADKKAKKARFIIDNDNDSTTIRIRAKVSVTIQRVIDKMYEHLGRARLDGDRLTRESDGSDVFASARMTVADYVGKTPARKRRWTFVGQPGGANS